MTGKVGADMGDGMTEGATDGTHVMVTEDTAAAPRAAGAAPAGPTSGWDCHVHVFDAAAPCLPGHYRPGDWPLPHIEQAAAEQGVAHLVLVQPSVYGSDHSVLVRALQQQPGRHRGVAVLGDDCSEALLDGLHAAGVRGARLNCVSPVGEAVDAARIGARFERLAPQLLQRGWHLQWYIRPEHLALVASLHGPGAPVCVLDHLAGLHLGIADDHPAWAALAALAGRGAWVKLSGWYRLGAVAPYTALKTQVARVAGLFGQRMVWGSDWPHTGLQRGLRPAYPSTWRPVVQALGKSRAQALRQAWPAIYR